MDQPSLIYVPLARVAATVSAAVAAAAAVTERSFLIGHLNACANL